MAHKKGLALLFISSTLLAQQKELTSFEDFYTNATAYLHEKKFEQAETYFTKALELNPHDLQTQFFLAASLHQQDKKVQACNLYKAIIARYPSCTPVIYNLAHALKELGNMEESAHNYTIVIQREPTNTSAHLGLAQCYLALGNFEQGWPHFEHRGPDIQQFKNNIETLKNLVDSKKTLANKRILLRTEWGIGDAIQFIQFAQKLKNKGAIIIMQARKELKSLFSLCPYIDEVVGVGEAFPAHDLQIPLLSLPYIVQLSIRSVENQQPYFYADEALVTAWKKKFNNNATFKIGLCWQGNGSPDSPPSLQKNIPLKELAPLAKLPTLSLYSLQQIKGLEELESLPETFELNLFDESFDKVNGRFMDTAAVMKNLDLVVTIDTSIAHLAGALGVPVWLLLPYRTDWRWYLSQTIDDTEYSLWYPTMRLFRQPKPGDWKSVIEDVISNLKQCLAMKSSAQKRIKHD